MWTRYGVQEAREKYSEAREKYGEVWNEAFARLGEGLQGYSRTILAPSSHHSRYSRTILVPYLVPSLAILTPFSYHSLPILAPSLPHSLPTLYSSSAFILAIRTNPSKLSTSSASCTNLSCNNSSAPALLL